MGAAAAATARATAFCRKVLQEGGLPTLLIDLLIADEEQIDARTARLRFDIGLLAARLAGAPGFGRTTLGLFWALADTRPDARTLFVTFAEHAEQLVRKASAFGLDLSTAQTNGHIRILRIPSVDMNPDWVATQVLGELASGEVTRIVFDDMSVLVNELGDRTRDYLSALNDMTYRANISCLYLLEIAPFEGLRVKVMNTPLAVLGDNVIVVQQYEITGRLRRLVAVLRMRLSSYDRTLRELVLDETGVHVRTPSQSMDSVLKT